MSEEKKVSAIVVNWNGMKFLPVCLDSLFKQTYKNLEVIVVDCASKDESVPFIKSNYPLTKVIELKQDFGPPYAINLAAREAQGEYVLILNNDVYLPTDLIEKMVFELKKDENSVLNPVELSFKDQYITSGCSSRWIGKYLQKIVKLKGQGPFFPSTACCLTTKKLVLENPLNQNLFMYEDVEWGWRLQLREIKPKVLKHGYFLHRGSGSEETPYSPKQAFFVGRATFSSCFICFKVPTLILISPVLLCNYFWQISVYLKRKKFMSVFAYTRGYFSFFVKFKFFLKDRKMTQLRREVDDLKVLQLMIGSIDFAKRAKDEWERSKASLKLSTGMTLSPQEVVR